VGVTSDLERRLAEHRERRHGFTAKYRIERLVYLETSPEPLAAIAREKQIKAYRRAKKIALITGSNPAWNNLADPTAQ
jgi:putative endonuclease